MPKKIKDLIYTTLFGVAVPVPQHEKLDGTFVETGEKNPLPTTLAGSNAINAVVVVPNDASDLVTNPTKGLYLGTGGDVKVTLHGGNTVTFVGLSAGVIHPIAVKRVWATGTNASNILAVY